jgi:hypothetical protein
MGFFDKARQLLGLAPSDASDERGDEAAAPKPTEVRPADPRAARLQRARQRTDRPPLADLPPEQGQSVDDALAARDAGDHAEARRILATIDRGAGLRTVLRAAAALEDGDQDELRSLLPAVAKEADGYKLWLQVAAALGDARAAIPYIERAVAEKAPAWAIAWTRVVAAQETDETARREALVELLFTDAPLARTVAARDLGVPGVTPDLTAASRYASFAHGRDSIRRFGARTVADLLEKAARS